MPFFTVIGALAIVAAALLSALMIKACFSESSEQLRCDVKRRLSGVGSSAEIDAIIRRDHLAKQISSAVWYVAALMAWLALGFTVEVLEPSFVWYVAAAMLMLSVIVVLTATTAFARYLRMRQRVDGPVASRTGPITVQTRSIQVVGSAHRLRGSTR